MGSIGIIVIYVVALGLMMYFLAIKPFKEGSYRNNNEKRG